MQSLGAKMGARTPTEESMTAYSILHKTSFSDPPKRYKIKLTGQVSENATVELSRSSFSTDFLHSRFPANRRWRPWSSRFDTEPNSSSEYWGQGYKTFYGRILRILVVFSWKCLSSVCPWQAFTA